LRVRQVQLHLFQQARLGAIHFLFGWRLAEEAFDGFEAMSRASSSGLSRRKRISDSMNPDRAAPHSHIDANAFLLSTKAL